MLSPVNKMTYSKPDNTARLRLENHNSFCIIIIYIIIFASLKGLFHMRWAIFKSQLEKDFLRIGSILTLVAFWSHSFSILQKQNEWPTKQRKAKISHIRLPITLPQIYVNMYLFAHQKYDVILGHHDEQLSNCRADWTTSKTEYYFIPIT